MIQAYRAIQRTEGAKPKYRLRSRDFSEGFAELDLQRSRVLTELLGALACDPRRAMPVANQMRVSSPLFVDHWDLLCIWTALEYDRAVGRDERWQAVPHCRFLLKHEGYWDEDAPISMDGSLWSDARLFWLFDAACFCPPYIRLLSKRAISLHRRARDAAEHLRYAARLLNGEAA